VFHGTEAQQHSVIGALYRRKTKMHVSSNRTSLTTVPASATRLNNFCWF